MFAATRGGWLLFHPLLRIGKRSKRQNEVPLSLFVCRAVGTARHSKRDCLVVVMGKPAPAFAFLEVQ